MTVHSSGSPAKNPEAGSIRSHVSCTSLIEMTRALVAADTRNPPGREHLAATVARRLLEPLGATFESVEPEQGRTSLIARLDPVATGRPTLIVNGHLDVVAVNAAGWTHDPFGGAIEVGRIWGRGTADMKGGIAAAIEAVLALDRAGRDRACDIIFHLVADEEQGGRLGTRALTERGLVTGDACLVPEPTSLDVCIAERGLLDLEVVVHGRPAHASEPSRGVSAVEKAAKVVLALHGADFGHDTHPLLGRPTANAGLISGGSAANIVAERCMVTVDHRTLPGQTQDDAVDDVRRLIERIGDAELAFELNPVVFGEASELAADHPWVSMVGQAVSRVRGSRAAVVGMTFATDARFVRNQGGIPTVVCGPGGIAQAHIDDEWVALDALVDAAAIYAELYSAFDAAAAGALQDRPLPRAPLPALPVPPVRMPGR